MRKEGLFVFLGIVLLFGGQSLSAQTKAEKKAEQESQIKEAIESGAYVIDVSRALPMSGRAVNLTSSYSLEVRNDSVYSHLPYFGQAYTAPYGGGEGMIFKEPLTDYKLTFDKKGTASVVFKTRNSEDTYEFRLQIFSNGSTTINVTSINKQGISYQGDLDPKHPLKRSSI